MKATVLATTNQLNNREWATLAWLCLFAVWALTRAGVARGLWGVVKVAASWKIWVPFVLLTAWIVGLCWLSEHVRLWDRGLVKDTAIWALGPAVVAFFSLTDAGKKPQFFRRALLAAVSYTVLLEFFINLYVFSLPVELVFVPVVTLTILTSLVAGMKQETMVVKQILDGITGLIGICLLLYVTVHLVRDWKHTDKLADLRELALPVWLAAGTLPYIYFLGLVSSYELAFLRIGWQLDDPTTRRRAKLALIAGLHVRYYAVANFGGSNLVELRSARSFKEALEIIRRPSYDLLEETESRCSTIDNRCRPFWVIVATLFEHVAFIPPEVAALEVAEAGAGETGFEFTEDSVGPPATTISISLR